MPGTDQKTTLELKLEKLRQICHKSPDNAIGLLALAETAFRRGLRLEALEAYQKVLKDESVAEAHLCMAQMYRHHGLFQETINELRVLFEIEPGYPEAHVFARELGKETTLPEDLEAVLHEGCGSDELALARVRLSIARSLVLREGQELVAIQDANANDPTFGYYIGETRKRLSYCEQVLSQLGVLEEARRNFLAEQERHRQIEQERLRELAERRSNAAAAAEQELLGPPVVATAELVDPAAGPEADESVEVQAADTEELLATDGPEIHVEPVVALDEQFPADADAAAGDPGYVDSATSDRDEWQHAAQADDYAQGSGEVEDLQTEVNAQPDPEHESEPPGVGFGEAVLSLGLGVASAMSGRPPEPALWDDGPRLGVGDTNPEPRGRAHELEPDLKFDMTPTLVGDLPDAPLPHEAPSFPVESPDPEPLQSSGLWDDDLAPAPQLPPVQERRTLSPPEEVVSEAEPAALSLPTVSDEPASSLPAVSPDAAALFERHPEPEPETPPAPEPPAAEPEIDEAADFAALYAPLLGNLENLIQTLAKTRGVSSVFLLNRHGYGVAEIIRDPLDRARVSDFIIETVSFLEGFASQPQYWVLECAGGIVVIQSVDNYHFLVTIGQTGANFGALRYTMDRVRPSFEQVLQPAIPAA